MRRMILGTVASLLLMAVGCGEKSNDKSKATLGPEETVEAFCRAVAGSEFKTAMSLCDTMAMKEYIEQYAEAWNVNVKKDSGATAIAAATLAEAEFIVNDVARDGEKRMITYTIAADGMNKKKTAVVRKDEGAWKVEKITDSL